jgi:hypothetical protein
MPVFTRGTIGLTSAAEFIGVCPGAREHPRGAAARRPMNFAGFRRVLAAVNMLAVLGGLADVERDLIRTRTAEGRSRAKAQGAHMGRPPTLNPTQQEEATRRRAQGATLQELAKSYDRSISTMRRVTRAA